jgi:hypothetical protein
MSVAMLGVVGSRRRMLLGLVVLPVRVMVSRLQVMVRSGVMVCSGQPMMLDGWVLDLLCHVGVLLKKVEDTWALRTIRGSTANRSRERANHVDCLLADDEPRARFERCAIDG